MSMFHSKKQGFTLVELMVVAVIVAILAAVLIPLAAGNKNRAYETEAIAAMGTIRNAMRVASAGNSGNAFPTFTGDVAVVSNVPGIIAGDLSGTYFSDDCYTITSTDGLTYTITCTWNNSDQGAVTATTRNVAPQAHKVNTTGYTSEMDQNGTITHYDGTVSGELPAATTAP